MHLVDAVCSQLKTVEVEIYSPLEEGVLLSIVKEWLEVKRPDSLANLEVLRIEKGYDAEWKLKEELEALGRKHNIKLIMWKNLWAK